MNQRGNKGHYTCMVDVMVCNTADQFLRLTSTLSFCLLVHLYRVDSKLSHHLKNTGVNGIYVQAKQLDSTNMV